MGDAPKSKGFSLTRAAKALQDNVAQSGPVASASYSLIGAILLLEEPVTRWTVGWAPSPVCGGSLMLG